jgi:hypothetical protein
MLSRWCRLHLQSLATNPHWTRLVGYGLFSFYVILEGLCSGIGDINRLMMIEELGGRAVSALCV